MNLLAQLICSRVRAEVFRVLFGLNGREAHLREIQRQTGFAIATVRQDLEKLVRMDVVSKRIDGNRVLYSANEGHPLFGDIRHMVLKTIGLADVLRGLLVDDGIRCAFIFGSMVFGRARAESDIDLMIIGDSSLRRVSEMLSGASGALGREINPHVLSPSEFSRRLHKGDHFLSSVMASPKIYLVGSQDELEAMAR